MAKSIRSKWKRKCRAIKRIRYGEKELEKLKKTLANDPLNRSTMTEDVMMKEIEKVANVKTAKEIINSTNNPSNNPMDLDEVAKEFNSKTLRNKNGAFPVWVHPRKIKAGKKKNKNKKKKKSKKSVKRNN